MNNIDGGKFSKENQKEAESKKKEEKQGQDATQFITDEPSLIKTEDVFAMLGEQVVRVANWKKIALAWQKQFEVLKGGIVQLKAKNEELLIANKQLGDSNIKYVENNNKLGNRITELNKALEEANKIIKRNENDYNQLNLRFEGTINQNSKLNKTIEESGIDIKNKNSE